MSGGGSAGAGASEVLAIVPARGGSRGIPHKNLRTVAGVPLVARSVAAARRARRVSRVVVSTEDAEIATVAATAGAEVVARPTELAGDRASSEAALLHVLERLAERDSYRPELVVFLQCTSPLTLPEDIDACVERLLAEGADCAFSAVRFHGFVWRPDEREGAVGVNHDRATRPRRQERAEEFLETGAVYVMRAAGFLAHRHRFFGRTVPVPLPADRAVEVDESADLELAELLAPGAGAGAPRLPPRIAALVFDFDGVMTDDRVWVGEDGREAVTCHRGDGLGLEMLGRQGLPMLVLSRERNRVVTARTAKLRLEALQGVDDKAAALRGWLADRSLDPANTIYVGNDVNDLECMRLVGCSVAVADAHPEVRRAADLVLSARGGRGAVRELVDLLLAKSRREQR